MPCYLVKAKYSIQISNIDRNVLAEALKLMAGVKSVEVTDYWSKNGIVVHMKDNRTLLGQVVNGNQVNFEFGAEDVAREVKKYYTATLQAMALKRQGFQATVQKQNNLLRVTGRR